MIDRRVGSGAYISRFEITSIDFQGMVARRSQYRRDRAKAIHLSFLGSPLNTHAIRSFWDEQTERATTGEVKPARPTYVFFLGSPLDTHPAHNYFVIDERGTQTVGRRGSRLIVRHQGGGRLKTPFARCARRLHFHYDDKTTSITIRC